MLVCGGSWLILLQIKLVFVYVGSLGLRWRYLSAKAADFEVSASCFWRTRPLRIVHRVSRYSTELCSRNHCGFDFAASVCSDFDLSLAFRFKAWISLYLVRLSMCLVQYCLSVSCCPCPFYQKLKSSVIYLNIVTKTKKFLKPENKLYKYFIFSHMLIWIIGFDSECVAHFQSRRVTRLRRMDQTHTHIYIYIWKEIFLRIFLFIIDKKKITKFRI